MNGDLTVRDVMTRDFVGVSESDSASGTARLLLEEDASAAVVLRGSDPVGLLTERDALAAIAEAEKRSIADATVADLMRSSVPTLDPDTALETAAAEMAATGTWWLAVQANDDLVGLLTAADVVAAAMIDGPGETEPLQEPDRHDQSICERCGALSRDLLERDGELVCPSCRAT